MPRHAAAISFQPCVNPSTICRKTWHASLSSRCPWGFFSRYSLRSPPRTSSITKKNVSLDLGKARHALQQRSPQQDKRLEDINELDDIPAARHQQSMRSTRPLQVHQKRLSCAATSARETSRAECAVGTSQTLDADKIDASRPPSQPRGSGLPLQI